MLLSALIMVCLALIIMPIINFTASNGGGSGANDDNDGMSTLQGTDAHYYLRDIFNLTVGLFACFLALSETASLTNECNRCIEVVFDLHKDTPWVPPIKGHLVLRDYVCSPQYASKFGFTIFGTKIENKHIAVSGGFCCSCCSVRISKWLTSTTALFCRPSATSWRAFFLR